MVVIIFTTIVLQILNIYLINQPFSYHRDTFVKYIYFQWISPSLVHYNWEHWLLNILNLFAIILFFQEAWTLKTFIGLFSFSSLFILVCLHVFTTDIDTYVGMSGVLYSLTVYGGLTTFSNQKIISSLILLYISLKLLADKEINHMMGVDVFLDKVNVVTDVHWYGVVFAIVVVLINKSIKSPPSF